MLEYIDRHGKDVGIQVNLPADELNGYYPVAVNHHDRMFCAVCKLEEDWMKRCNMRWACGEGSRQQLHMSICSDCGISAHSLPVLRPRKIFLLTPFVKKSCFQIVHSTHCASLFIPKKVKQM